MNSGVIFKRVAPGAGRPCRPTLPTLLYIVLRIVTLLVRITRPFKCTFNEISCRTWPISDEGRSRRRRAGLGPRTRRDELSADVSVVTVVR
ncbi:hypothetical protein EVAR_97675_1 [Eumeta japonica]|uniref:Uncharacterized protein n=1 Tax=Eumeta variegata TaxID=151549 RepID=A0A4C1WZ29_EUMVA|nr:hypothetical protein EVAR_97675_1 [Eumeta japonica]